MKIKRFKITPIDDSVKRHCLKHDLPYEWIIAAKDETSAWDKFITQRFGVLKASSVDYEVNELEEEQ